MGGGPFRLWHKHSMHRYILPFALLMVAACSASDTPRADGLTAGEHDKLEAAAARLDSKATTPGAADAAALEADVTQRLDADMAAKRP